MGRLVQSSRYVLLLLAILAYTVVYLYRFQRKQAFDREYQYLLQRGSFSECQNHLRSASGIKIYHDYELMLRELEAAFRFDNRAKARKLIKELLFMPMKEKDFVDFHNKALNFAVMEKDPVIAEHVFEAFSKYKRHAQYAAEARQIVDIYLYRKANHIDGLVSAVDKMRKPSRKATAYYRIARQYYSLGEVENCQRYLEMAYMAFPDKTWQKLINELLKGNYEQFS